MNPVTVHPCAATIIHWYFTLACKVCRIPRTEFNFLTGLVQSTKVIRTCQGGSKFKLPDDGNWELFTAIECIAGDGRVTPSLIYKGANHYMGWHRFTGRDEESKRFWLSYAKKGWADQTLGMEWLVEVVDKETEELANG